MLIPNEILQSVVFLGHYKQDSAWEVLKLGGTAFAVSVPREDGKKDFCHLYFVTARHSVLGLRGKDCAIRANTEDGPCRTYRIGRDERWWFHPTEPMSVDVAVLPFDGLDTKDIQIAPIPKSMFLTDHGIAEYYVGQGDDLYMTGLFTKLTGDSRNIPIVRRGSIAMLPEDKIPSVRMGDGFRDVEAYLAEVRSVGGLSGSPAFVRASIGLDCDVHAMSGERRIARAHIQGDYFLLGLMMGHWEIPPGKRNAIELPCVKDGEDSVNLGIALVAPAKKILEVLNHPELVACRIRAEKESEKSKGTTEMDSAFDEGK